MRERQVYFIALYGFIFLAGALLILAIWNGV
jgi:hypothetical protein